MSTDKNNNLQQFDTDDPNRIQDLGWTFKEIWRRTRGIVVVSINLITFFILVIIHHIETFIPYRIVPLYERSFLYW